MPGNGVGTLFEEVSRSGIISTSVDKMNFWVAFWTTGCRVDMVATEVSSELQSVLDVKVGKVLITESFHKVRGAYEGWG